MPKFKSTLSKYLRSTRTRQYHEDAPSRSNPAAPEADGDNSDVQGSEEASEKAVMDAMEPESERAAAPADEAAAGAACDSSKHSLTVCSPFCRMPVQNAVLKCLTACLCSFNFWLACGSSWTRTCKGSAAMHLLSAQYLSGPCLLVAH